MSDEKTTNITAYFDYFPGSDTDQLCHSIFEQYDGEPIGSGTWIASDPLERDVEYKVAVDKADACIAALKQAGFRCEPLRAWRGLPTDHEFGEEIAPLGEALMEFVDDYCSNKKPDIYVKEVLIGMMTAYLGFVERGSPEEQQLALDIALTAIKTAIKTKGLEERHIDHEQLRRLPKETI